MTNAGSLKAQEMIGFYHQLNNKRQDTWVKLKKYTFHLSSSTPGDAGFKRLKKAVKLSLTSLETIEDYTAFPSKEDFRYLWIQFQQKDYVGLAHSVSQIHYFLENGTYRRKDVDLSLSTKDSKVNLELEEENASNSNSATNSRARPYFEVLIVDDLLIDAENQLLSSMRAMRHHDDGFIYSPIVAPTFEDAIIAILINPNIQACIIRPSFPMSSKRNSGLVSHIISGIDEKLRRYVYNSKSQGSELGRLMKYLRPELDLYLVSDMAMEATNNQTSDDYFRRVFYSENSNLDMHHSILAGIASRYDTPFFSALKKYSRKPTGTFHALPISRAKSIEKSNWIGDMLDFYGANIFLAETSTTSGGLDSLLQPKGPLKQAQEYAARAYGAKRTYFVTNGTSTANKIVVQALVKPGDIILVDRDCHKSHHYGMVLAGAHVKYLDSYPINDLSIYGGVPIKEIKRTLLHYKSIGQLDRVKMLLLTNCTFDGVVYNVRRVMEECLAIKPDLVFLWDEAWFAFATFNPIYRTRTAMFAAGSLTRRYSRTKYRKQYQEYKAELDKLSPEQQHEWMLENRLIPDPDKVRIRTYTTHSTHKTLTSLRQGSMIHVHDQDFRQKVEAIFNEAYMTHTSTSPNYQILASLDIGRRQVELEGYELVNKQLELAMTLRQSAYQSERLRKYFDVLVNKHLVPDDFRESGVESYFNIETGFSQMEEAWADDEFVVDPTRITVHIGKTGIDGNTFKDKYLMDKHGIQINKTSRNTILFMVNIGTSRSSIMYLLDCLYKTVNELELRDAEMGPTEKKIHLNRVKSLTKELPPLPDFSYFHDAFLPGKANGSDEGDIRKAYFLSYEYDNYEYVNLDNGELERAMKAGREFVSSSFIIPYPPGFPILVPGQVISEEILAYMKALDVKEIHGYNPELGLSVFTEDALASVMPEQQTTATVQKTVTEDTQTVNKDSKTNTKTKTKSK
ncbi:aminotransferase class I/II-fold pyridoxal phosphate-dependent enzyme [Endozoicomonas sp. G2_1]|uniref:aminotransferase class I/II-fold pyridoxal phosphate-dependent enzyme n=1 Tax=Endozoicomonas sp. G2_1 TaxID=2821091 RepID=UPI001ADC1F34|nr:aminotransferase class I/II-fold pyridoxal phosphate-dependent enzyme [Endozoicomonas sp. G2_1]MBO9491417.1 aminotransferase class I/II-fold pyridoxal phosphate-dependent enzyme [Endozoicomonas sp. G2_1]